MNSSQIATTKEKISAISQLAGRVVHDLNNFSTIFVNVCELLKDDLVGNEEALIKLKMIQESGDKLLAYTQELNSIRLRKEIVSSPVNVNRILGSVIADLPQVKLIKSPTEVWAKISEERLKKILEMLIANAREASPEQEITIDCKNCAGFVEISVCDHGVGMNEEHLAHLCEPYFSLKQNVKGSGLSLTKAFSWLDNIGGSLSFESTLGQGTNALMRIPEGEGQNKSSGEAPIEVLLVDDQAPLRKVATEILTKRGFKVLEAANGVAAWELARSRGKNISILITDINMPEMDGHELAKKLHERFSHMKVLFMSGFNDDGSGAKIDDKNTAFLSKPFTKDLLLKAVDKILQ